MSTHAHHDALAARGNAQCELCKGTSTLSGFDVPPVEGSDPERAILVCSVCSPQLEAGAELDSNHWYCLQESIWSEVAAVQVASWRMLQRLKAEVWAQDILDQAYLAPEVEEWANQGLADSDDDNDTPPTVDCNGTALADGDSVTLIKDLDVKGANFTAKRGTMVKGIRLTDNPEHIDARVSKVSIVLKTCFVKKAT